jgi:hypothetical protein
MVMEKSRQELSFSLVGESEVEKMVVVGRETGKGSFRGGSLW